MGITEILDGSYAIYGCDTETYNDMGARGLKSIQIVGTGETHYFTAQSYDLPDDDIRASICSDFFGWLEGRFKDSIIAFFNLDFDFSQMLTPMLRSSPWSYTEAIGRKRQPKGTWSALETDQKLYKVTIKTSNGVLVTFVDIANFLTATTLDKACSEWLGEHKLELESKKFAKAHPTEIEQRYAMRDADLTCRLFIKLNEEGVTEDIDYVTIAGRTLGHFKDFLRHEYSMSFTQWCYGTDDKEYVEEQNLRNEELLRESNRGGMCMAVHKGYFPRCTHVDKVSMYPAQMVRDRIPYGPILDNPPDRDYTIIHYPSCFLTLKDGKIPYLQWNSNAQCTQYRYINDYKAGEYVKDAFLDGSHAFWDDEWKIIEECYDIEDFSDDPKFIEMKPNKALKAYIEMLFKGKATSKGTKRYFYKILMNSLYGKFLSRPDGKRITYANGYRETIKETDKKMYYLPLGSWIAMRGRVTLAECLLSIPADDVLYCDTDSCIFKGDKFPNVSIGKTLADWSIENRDFDAWIVGPKTYQELNYGAAQTIPYNPLLTKCAGLNKVVRDKITFRGLAEGQTYIVQRALRSKKNLAKSVEEIPYVVNTRAGVLK